MPHHGSYAKGVAKREEILSAALQVIAERGYSATSLREIAEAVGLSQTGVLHHFASKDELFVEVLRRRDEIDLRGASSGFDPMAGTITAVDMAEYGLAAFVQIVRHNAEVPGLVQLFSHVAAEATDPAHPGHEYFQRRTAEMIAQMGMLVQLLQQAGRFRTDVSSEWVASAILTFADGLQTRWLMDPRLDMAADLETFLQQFRLP